MLTAVPGQTLRMLRPGTRYHLHSVLKLLLEGTVHVNTQSDRDMNAAFIIVQSSTPKFLPGGFLVRVTHFLAVPKGLLLCGTFTSAPLCGQIIGEKMHRTHCQVLEGPQHQEQ